MWRFLRGGSLGFITGRHFGLWCQTNSTAFILHFFVPGSEYTDWPRGAQGGNALQNPYWVSSDPNGFRNARNGPYDIQQGTNQLV